MTSRISSTLALLAALTSAVTLSACGKKGSYQFELTTQQAFEVAAGDSVVAFNPDQKMQGVASYAPLLKRLQLEIGGEKIVFKGAKLDKEKSEIVASPADSGIRTTGGELLGISTKRTLVCNPDCERVERDVREEYCTYYETVPELFCNGWGPVYGPGYGHGNGAHCYTRWVSRPRTGRQTVERTVTTREYEINGSIFGATLGEMASTHSNYTQVSTSSRALTACF